MAVIIIKRTNKVIKYKSDKFRIRNQVGVETGQANRTFSRETRLRVLCETKSQLSLFEMNRILKTLV